VVQCGAVWCSVLQCVAVFILAQCAVACTPGSACRRVLQCGAVRCIVLQYFATCCNVLQCVAVFCSVLRIAWRCVNSFSQNTCMPVSVFVSAMQCAAVCCSVVAGCIYTFLMYTFPLSLFLSLSFPVTPSPHPPPSGSLSLPLPHRAKDWTSIPCEAASTSALVLRVRRQIWKRRVCGCRSGTKARRYNDSCMKYCNIDCCAYM